MSRAEALQKAKKMKAEALGIQVLRFSKVCDY
jgi:hypothetical protein